MLPSAGRAGSKGLAPDNYAEIDTIKGDIADIFFDFYYNLYNILYGKENI
jgi:hypothetical protein